MMWSTRLPFVSRFQLTRMWSSSFQQVKLSMAIQFRNLQLQIHAIPLNLPHALFSSCRMPGPARKTPFSAEEVEKFRSVIFPGLPTYRAEYESVASCDIGELCEKLSFERSAEQLAMYIAYVDKCLGWRISLEASLGNMLNAHSSAGFLHQLLKSYDKNGDGYIQKEEYELFFDVNDLHHGGDKKSFEEFVKEADANADGKVSIAEAVKWFNKRDA